MSTATSAVAFCRTPDRAEKRPTTVAYKGNIARLNPSKKVVSIMFHRGAEIPGDHSQLEGDGKLVRTMRFAGLDELKARRGDLEAVIRAWCDWKASA